MLKIGLTGGIGSGKTTVAKVFESLGIPVYYADDKAKYLMNNDARLKASIIQQFGTDAYKNEELDEISKIINQPAETKISTTEKNKPNRFSN